MKLLRRAAEAVAHGCIVALLIISTSLKEMLGALDLVLVRRASGKTVIML